MSLTSARRRVKRPAASRRRPDGPKSRLIEPIKKTRIAEEVRAIVTDPSAFRADPLRGEFARALLAAPPPPRAEPVKYRQWGEGLETEAVMQMEIRYGLTTAGNEPLTGVLCNTIHRPAAPRGK